MKVVIIGSGGREHAICVSLINSKKINKCYCIPGNAGTKLVAENVDIETKNFEEIKNFIKDSNIDFVVVGPEQPLVDGIVDYLEKHQIKVFGPNKIASQLEGSKIFTKKLCEKYNIPTANFGIFTNLDDSINFLEKCNLPIVVKADGLAAGKGVYICYNKKEASSAIKEVFNGKFGLAKNILIEEFLEGEEMSFFIISDGETFAQFGTAQDHKRVFEGDKGKNTGGMGAYSPSRLEDEKLNQKILDKIIEPTMRGLNDMNTKFKGFLYAGLMIIKGEPFLIEYNVRMGDPECQTILPKLKTDLLEIILACCNERLNETNIEWSNKKSLCIVLCSKGYPEKIKKNVKLNNLNKIRLDYLENIYHAGTKSENNEIYAVGGRVLNFVSLSDNFADARKSIINKISELNWPGGFYRKDIGFKVINE